MSKKPETSTATLLAQVPTNLAKAIKKRLIDEGVSYKDWLIQQIENYLKGGKK